MNLNMGGNMGDGVDSMDPPSISGMPMDSTPMGGMPMGGMPMDGMPMDGATMGGPLMGSMPMSMAFYNSVKTTLYTTMWTPNNASTYAATCIFLIVLASGHRFLLALKSWLEMYWMDAEANRRYATSAGKLPISERIAMDPKSRKVILSENGVEEDVIIIQKKFMAPRPWRMAIDPIRAILDTLIIAVGFFIMLAVMTMNVGYFISVLAGSFLGSLIAGRFTGLSH